MKTYRKHYIPLESNPELFTQLCQQIGLSPSLAFQDVYSIDDAELLAFLPRPAYALILVFPTSDTYERQTAEEEARRDVYNGSGDAEPVMWYKQTIHNACGLYGILHAVSNGDAREHICEFSLQPPDDYMMRVLFGLQAPGSTLDNLLKTCIPLDPKARALALEDSADLERAHTAAATQGDSAVPENAEDEVYFHYVCFVKSHKDGQLYEMDGDRCA
jgi:ubiquitin carboxyl-terminal hydrolase L3